MNRDICVHEHEWEEIYEFQTGPEVFQYKKLMQCKECKTIVVK